MALVAVLTGCSFGASAKDPKVAIRDAIKSVYSITSAGYEVTTSGVMMDSTQGGPGNIEFNFGLTGAADLKDATKPLLTAKIAGTGKSPTENGGLDAELRLDAQNAYGVLSKMTIFVKPDDKSLDGVLGKWYKMPIPAGAFDQMQIPFPIGKTDDQLTPEEKQMKDLVTTTDFFKDVTLVGSETVLGEKANHYTAGLDVESIGAFTAKGYALKNQPVDDTQIATMKENLTKLNPKFDIWVGDDGMFRKASMNMTAGEEEKASGQYLDNFKMSVGLNNINGPVTVEAPAGALDLDPNVLMQFGTALQGVGTGLSGVTQ